MKSFERTVITKEYASSLQSTSCIKSSIPVAWINDEGLPFFCVWGWEFTLSLEKEFEGATRVILLWNSAPFVLLDIFNICSISNDNGVSLRRSSFINCFVERGVFNCSSTVKELRSCNASFENTGNLGTSTFLRCYVSVNLLSPFDPIFWGGKNRGSMDPVHILMDPVHGGGPWIRGPCFVLSL